MAGIGVLGAMTPNYVEKGQGFMRNAIAAHSARSDKYKEQSPPGNTIGGGIMATAGGVVGGLKASGGQPIGGMIGGIVGLAGYGLS